MLPFTSAESYTFLSIGDIFQDSSALTNETNVVLRIKFLLDSKYQSIQRTVYTVGDMFGQIGGINSILLSIGSFIVGAIATKIYMASLLSSFYHINSNKNIQKVTPFKIIEEHKCTEKNNYSNHVYVCDDMNADCK